jgi:hypothetical protein
MTGKLGMKKPEDLKKLISKNSSSVESKEIQSSLPVANDDQDLFTKT